MDTQEAMLLIMSTGNQGTPPCILYVGRSKTQHALTWRHVMKPTAIVRKHVAFLLMISLLMSLGCAIPSTQAPTTVGPQCSIEWDKVID